VEYGRGPVVVDTMVFSWSLSSMRSHLYAPHIQGRALVLAAQTAAELWASALIGGWGESRRRELDERISRVRVAGATRAIANVYAQLKASCRAIGHPLHEKIHDGDRWIAATAVRYSIPLVSHDGVFKDVPGLELITELEV
jgi:predicted nucleic acid-binding protein